MKAVICGAGIAGLTLAWWLERDGWQVTLVERAPGRRDEGYMIDFFGSGYDVAERMELLPRLQEIHITTRRVDYVSPDGRGRGHLEYDDMAALLDGRAFTFMRGELERVLHDALDGRVPIRYDVTVDAVRHAAGGLEVSLSDGTVEPADLLVGADGIHSRVRTLTFGPERPYLRCLGYHTASYLFTDERLRAQVRDRFLVVAVPDRQVGLYPTEDGRLAAWLVHRAAGDALPADPRAELLGAYRGMGELVDSTLEHCPSGRGLYYDLVAQIELDGWARGSTTLVGDACQAVSLLAGQGASMAMGGAYVLAEELRRGGPVEAATARYEQRMRPFIRDKQKAGRRTAEWLVPSSRWRLAARAGAFAVTRMPGLSTLMRPAFGAMRASVVTGDAAPVGNRTP